MSENSENKVASPVGVVIISAEEYRKMIEDAADLRRKLDEERTEKQEAVNKCAKEITENGIRLAALNEANRELKDYRDWLADAWDWHAKEFAKWKEARDAKQAATESEVA